MWDNNIYYNPEKFGVELVGEFEWSEPSWSFDTLAVFKERRGRYWIAEDSGCSCPSPFENYTDLNELDGPYTKDGLRKRIDTRIEERTGERSWGYPKAVLKKSASEILSRLS